MSYHLPKIISFIGYITGVMLLVNLPSNPGKRVLVEAGVVIGAAAAVYAIHYLAYDMIMQGDPPGRAMLLSLTIVGAFSISYAVWRLFILRKAKGGSRNRSLIAATAATTIVGLVVIAAAYPHPVILERPSGDDLIFRLNTT